MIIEPKADEKFLQHVTERIWYDARKKEMCLQICVFNHQNWSDIAVEQRYKKDDYPIEAYMSARARADDRLLVLIWIKRWSFEMTSNPNYFVINKSVPKFKKVH